MVEKEQKQTYCGEGYHRSICVIKLHPGDLSESFSENAYFRINVIIHTKHKATRNYVHILLALDELECAIFANRILFFLDTWSPKNDVRR